MVGKSCTYSCTHGYIPKASNSVVCTSEGSWEMDMMDNDTLCSRKIGTYLVLFHKQLYIIAFVLININKQIKYVYTKMPFASVLKSKDDSTHAVRCKEFL